MPMVILFLLGMGLIGTTIFMIVDRPVSNVEKIENDVIRICSAKGEYKFQTTNDFYLTCEAHKVD